jgi:hypothetical protein
MCGFVKVLQDKKNLGDIAMFDLSSTSRLSA